MRNRFHVPENYFLSHSVGCQPKNTSDYIQTHMMEPWRSLGSDAWPVWMDVLDGFRSGIGGLLGVSQDSICPQSNVSSGLTKIVYSLPRTAGRNTILLSAQDFPTNGFVFKQAERAGYHLRFVDGDITDAQNWADAMDETVSLVHITHALSNTSALLPVVEICAQARAKGCFSIVDIAQSVGIVPINLADWHVDFALGSSVKFICGGPGACFLYANPDIISECRPVDVGWFSHENPFEMDIHNFRYAQTAMRFFGGTPSPLPFASALAALKTWQDIGIETAHSHAQSLLTTLSSCVPDPYLVSLRGPNLRGGTLVVAPPKPDKLASMLTAASIAYDQRKQGFRFSVHGYTSKAECDKLGEILRSI